MDKLNENCNKEIENIKKNKLKGKYDGEIQWQFRGMDHLSGREGNGEIPS